MHGHLLFQKNWLNGTLFSQPIHKHVIAASVVVVALFTISYFRLPQKSGYMITIIPFVLILAGYYLNGKWFITLCCSLILSSFIFSVNLTDKLRGAEYSKLAMKLTVSGQEIFIDPISGPIFSDYSKRRQKERYVKSVFKIGSGLPEKAVVIAGWWYNEITVEDVREQENCILDERIPQFVPYINEKQMRGFIDQGYKIYYLPEQDIYNNQMFGMKVTDQLASPF